MFESDFKDGDDLGFDFDLSSDPRDDESSLACDLRDAMLATKMNTVQMDAVFGCAEQAQRFCACRFAS